MLASRLPRTRFARAAVRRAPLAAALAILAGLSCFDDPAGPHLRPSAQFSFVPVFSSSAAMVVDFDRVRIVFTRPGSDIVVLDTVVSFPSDADSIALSLAVPVAGVGQSENLVFNLALINAAGDTVFRGGPNNVTVTAGTMTASVPVPIRYVGTGANAASVRITERDTSVFFGDGVVLTAVVLDSTDHPIHNTPIEWTSLDTGRAAVPAPNVGRVLGRTQRGPARIRARLLTGQADTSVVRVQPVPSALALAAGNGQTGTVDATLAQPLAVRVTAVDGLGVVGVRVRFSVVSGGGKVDTLVVTDTAGLATAQLRLGTTSGLDTVRAAVTGLTGSPITFVATAQPGAAKSLAVTVQPSTTPAGSFITPAIQVAARDTFGNVATAFSGTVTLAIGTNPASGTLSGSTAVAAAGIATFGTVSINRPGTGYTLTATATGLVAATTAAFEVVPGTPAKLVFAVQPSQVTAGAAIAPAPQIQVTDALGNLVPSFTDTVAIALAVNPGGSTLSGTLRVAAVNGVATFAALRLNRPGAGYRLYPSYASFARDSSALFTVNVGPAAQLAFTVQPTASTAGAALTPAPQVTVQDSVGNTVTTFSDTVHVAFGANPGGATLSGTATVNAVAGVATFSNLSLNRTGTGYTFTAASAALTPDTSTAFAVAPAAAAQLAFTQQPSVTTAGAAIAPPVQVTARDAFGNVVTSFNQAVTMALATNPGGATLSGTPSVTAIAGVATFSDLSLDRTGTGYTLSAAATGLSAATSAAFAVTPAAPAALAFTAQPTPVVAGTAITPAVVVAVRDALGNVATGYTDPVTIALATNPGGATLSGTPTVNAVAGIATFADLSLDRAATGYTLSASSAALPPATSTAFAVAPAAPALIAASSGNAQSGVVNAPLAAPFVALVLDAFGNPVGGVPVTFRVTTGGGTLAGLDSQVVATDPTGHAATTLTLGTAAGANTVTATRTGLTGSPVTFTATGAPAPAATLALVSGNAQSGTVNTALGAPFIVRTLDSFNNPVSGVSVTFLVTAGGGTLGGGSSQVVTTDAIGQAVATLTLGTAAGANTVTATSTGLTGSPVTFTATGTAGAAATLGLVSGNAQDGIVNSALAAPFVVRVQDAFANPVSGTSVTFLVTAGFGMLSGSSTQTVATDALGLAAATLTLGTTAGANTVTASSGSLAGSPVTFNALANAGAATQVAFSTQPPDTALAGATFGAAVTARDAFGNTALGATGSVTLTLATGPDSLGGTRTQPLAAGVATFPDLVIGIAGAGYTIRATLDTMTVVSTAFVVRAGPATAVVRVSGNGQLDTVGLTLAQPLVVRVRDAIGNGIPGDTVTFTPSAGSTTPTLAVTNAAGEAQTTWTLPTTAGPLTLDAVRTGLPTTTFTATAMPGAATQVAFTTQPTTTMASHTVPMSPDIVITAQDQHGNTATSYSGAVTVVAAPYDFVLGTRTVAAVAGVATFPGLRLDRAQTGYTVRATSAALTPDTSVIFDVTPGIPMAIAVASGNSQTGSVNAALVAPLVAAVQDSFGNAVPGFTVTWAVTSGGGSLPAFSLTNAAGLAQASWTLGALVGAQTAAAAASSGLTGAPLVFTATASPLGATSTWLGSASTDWGTGANWTAGAAPTPTDTVFVPAAAGQQPHITASAMVGGLIVQNGATLTIDTLLMVTGSADASYASVGGPGTVSLAGAGKVRGHFRALTVQGAYAIRDSLLVTDMLVISGATADLAGGGGSGAYARIGDLMVISDGTLSMTFGDSIDVLGSANFAGGSTNGRLMGGTLRVAGDFSQVSSTSAESFSASINHRLVLNGTTRQTVAMTTGGGTGLSRIGDLVVANTTDTVELTFATMIADRLEIPAGAHVVASDTLRLNGGFDGLHLAAGASLIAPTVLHTGPTVIDPAAVYQVRNTVFAMASGLQDIPALTYDSVTSSGYDTVSVLGRARFTGPTTLAGDLLVFGSGEAQLAGQHVLVQGRLVVGDTTDAGGTRNGGQLRMDQIGDSLVVYGDVYFGGAPTTAGYLTNGVLDLWGNFRQLARGGTQNNFVPSGAFTTVFDWPINEVPQRVWQENPVPSPFRNVLVRSLGAGLSLETFARANGSFTTLGSARVTQASSYSLQVNGDLTATGRLDLARLRVDGALNASALEGDYNVQQTVFGASGQTIPDTLQLRYVMLGPGGSAAFTAGMTLTMDTLITLGQLDMNGAKITTGYFETNDATGVLVMDAADDSLAVNGNARFLGGPSVLTAGTMHVTGGTLVENGTGTTQAFAAAAAHTTTLEGTSFASFAHPDTAASHFGRLIVAQNGTATLESPAVAAGRTSIGTYASLGGSGRLLALDTVSFGNFASQLNPAVVELRSGVASFDVFHLSPTDTLILRGSDGIPDTVTGSWTVPNLIVAGTDSVIDGGGTTFTGSVFVQSGTLAMGIGGSGATINDSLVVTGTGVFAIAATEAAVTVNGDVRFAGGSTAGHLGSGASLSLGGNFRQEGDPEAFAPAPDFSVYATGGASQVFSFANPGPAQSHFGSFSARSQVRLASDAYFAGQVLIYNTPTAGSVDDTLGSWTATLASTLTDLTPGSGWRPDNTIIAVPTTSWPAATNTNLFVRNELTATDYTVTGTVTVEDGGILDPGIGSVTADNSLVTTGTGVLRQSGGYVRVGQDASFAGATELTGGYLEINGNFEQLGTTSFQASAPHTTSFNNSTVTQTVSFAAPDTAFGTSGSYFGNLEMGASSGVVQLLTDAAVQGTFQSGDISSPTLTGAHTLFMRGLNQNGLLIDATLLTLVDGGSADFSYTTFQNQPATATQLRIRRSDSYLLFDGLTFNSTPTTGYYVAVENLSGAAQTVEFQTATPAVPGLFVQRSGSPLPTVTWNGTPVASAIHWANTAGGAWSVPANWAGGGAPLATDFAVIDAPGTYTVSIDAPAAVAGLSASYGELDINGQRLDVNGSFALSNAATLRMANPADSLSVTGSASFAGGSTAGLLTAGALTVGGNFDQGGDPASFSASGTHLTWLRPAAAGTVTMAASDTTSSSHFANLNITPLSSGTAIAFNSNVSVLGDVVLAGGGASPLTVSGTGELTVRGGVQLSTSGMNVTVSNTALRVGGLLSLGSSGAGFSPSEVEFFGSTVQRAPAYAAYQAMTITGDSVVFSDSGATLTGDLTIRGNGLAHHRAGVVTVGGGLTTQDAGALRMDGGVPWLSVSGDVVFGGGSTNGRLTSGQLLVGGNFTQSTTAAAFAATGTHRVSFTRASGVQTVQFQDSVNSFFSYLDLNRPAVDTVRLLSNVLVNDSAIVNGQTVLASTADEALKVPAAGTLRVHTGAVLRPSRAEFGTLSVDTAWSGSARIFPDTAVFLNATSFPQGAAYGLRHIRVAGGTLMSSGSHVVNGNLVISGGAYRVDTYASDSVAGYLRTEGFGKLYMLNSGYSMAPILAVRDSAVFAGGISDSLLEGTFRLWGDFRQVYGTINGATFKAGPNHRTVLMGATPNVDFGSVGVPSDPTASNFGALWLGRTTGLPQTVTVGAGGIYADMLVDTAAGTQDTIRSAVGSVISLGGFNMNGTVLDSVKVASSAGSNPINGNDITFRRFPATLVYQMEITRPAGVTPISMNLVRFHALRGAYIAAYQSGGTGGPFTLSFTNSTPASISGYYVRTGGAVLNWNGTQLP